MKLYVVSGLGADFSVLSRIQFPNHLDVVYLPWLMPKTGEPLAGYVRRMAAGIDTRAPFCLLGYSFGGIIVQEIHKIMPAEKVVIVASIRTDREKSGLLRMLQITDIASLLPTRAFQTNAAILKIATKMVDAGSPLVIKYFTVRDAFYLKWSLIQIARWKSPAVPGVVQIIGSSDQIFPPKSSPGADYIIEGGTHLLPVAKAATLSQILQEIFKKYRFI